MVYITIGYVPLYKCLFSCSLDVPSCFWFSGCLRTTTMLPTAHLLSLLPLVVGWAHVADAGETSSALHVESAILTRGVATYSNTSLSQAPTYTNTSSNILTSSTTRSLLSSSDSTSSSSIEQGATSSTSAATSTSSSAGYVHDNSDAYSTSDFPLLSTSSTQQGLLSAASNSSHLATESAASKYESSTAGVGDYVAAGLNLQTPSSSSTVSTSFASSPTSFSTPSTANSTNTTTAAASSRSSAAVGAAATTNSTTSSNAPSADAPKSGVRTASTAPSLASLHDNGSARTGNRTTRSSNAVTSKHGLPHITGASSRLASGGNTTAGSAKAGHANGTAIYATLTGDCWEQWTEYWDYQSTPTWTRTTYSTTEVYTSFGKTWYLSTRTTTYTVPKDTYTVTLVSGGTTVTNTGTEGPFTETLPRTDDVQTTTATLARSTVTRVVESAISPASSSRLRLTTPACSLPSIVPACESSWSSYMASMSSIDTNWVASREASPSCRQVSLASTDCDLWRKNYLENWSILGNDGNGGFININGTGTSSWPTTQSFAPGCTLGCWRCAITGQSVQLLYWPTSRASASANASQSMNVTARAGSAEIVTAVMESKQSQCFRCANC